MGRLPRAKRARARRSSWSPRRTSPRRRRSTSSLPQHEGSSSGTTRSWSRRSRTSTSTACSRSSRGYLPEGPRWFPEGTTTDQPLEVLIAEFVREKILRTTWDEVPHAVGVMVDDLEHDERKDLWRIEATVFVERDSQKGIIVGKGGEGIKRIGSEARADLERLARREGIPRPGSEGEVELAPGRFADPAVRLRRGRVTRWTRATLAAAIDQTLLRPPRGSPRPMRGAPRTRTWASRPCA